MFAGAADAVSHPVATNIEEIRKNEVEQKDMCNRKMEETFMEMMVNLFGCVAVVVVVVVAVARCLSS